MLALRSVAYNVLFYLNLILHILVGLPTLLMPPRVFMTIAKSWGRTSNALLVVAGISVELRGREKIPPGALLVASKHQSFWEAFTLLTLFGDPAFIVKRELMWIPFFGWYLWKAKQVPVDRRAKGGAMAGMIESARAALADGRQIIIFPEGTRTAPNAEPTYKTGITNLYVATNAPCVPVALNSGVFWPRRKFLRYPGTIVLEVLDPIPPGLGKDEFAARLQDDIETASNRLIAAGQKQVARYT